MGLLDSESGKRRLLTVEVPVIERYNEDRDAEFKIQLVRLGSTLVLRYRLQPMHNVYQLETRLVSSYPVLPPETRVIVLAAWKRGGMLPAAVVEGMVPLTGSHGT